ncbi:MAG: ring-hydroxylating oxygenase subunit alpha [Betaproteobacteria bacterium]|nr:ring-hydroxylating oxygenase subunit alpha [Betaproteobacteria bacterium]
MLSATDNEMLTKTNMGTPMGNLFREFWIPVLLSEEIAQPDGPQVPLKIMGEDLLAFRNTEGKVGLIEPRCSHRGANLFFGRNEEGGIRCAYHGWKFDIEGQCQEMPTVPPEAVSRMCKKASIKSYPVREWGGMVWAFMSSRRPLPELPHLEFALLPTSHLHVSKKFQECNWAQAAEGGLDTAHFSFLHQPVGLNTEDMKAKAAFAVKGYAKGTMNHEHVRWMREDSRPRYEVKKHAAGMVLGTSRQANEGERYWRIAQYLLPSHGYTPSATPGQTYHGQTWIPIDDENCWVFVYSWNPERPLTEEERTTFKEGGAVYPQKDANYVPLRNRSNNYLIDREMQKTENFTGIVGVSEQDAAIQDSQGSIADRTRELLGPTDLGVVQFRRLMLGSAIELQKGVTPPAVDAPESYHVRAGGIVASEQKSFAEVMEKRFGDEIGFVRSNVDKVPSLER